MDEAVPVALRSQHPRLDAVLGELDNLDNIIEQKQEFCQKQVDHIMKKGEEEAKEVWDKQVKPLWEEVRQILQEEGLLPENYDKKKHHIQYSENGVIYAVPKDLKEAP